MKSGFNEKYIKGAFELLATANLPYDTSAFNFNIFENKNIKIQDEFKNFKSKPNIGINENENDEKNTHPNINSRKLAAARIITANSSNKNIENLLSESDFYKIREMARFELPELFLLNGNYAEAMYHSNLLLKTYSNNIYLKNSLHLSFFGSSS